MYNFFKLKFKNFSEKKTSYSFGGIDALINNIFKKQNSGFYVDVGCNHPIKNNNTYLLFKKGWNGINIDVDPSNIEIFNHARPKDKNINIGVSDKKGFENLYFYHDKSSINTLDKTVSRYQKAKISKIKRVETLTLNEILENTTYKNLQIDFLSIDVEGSEMKVLKNFNFYKYSPKIVVVEFLDLSLKNLEIKNLNIENVLRSELYKFMISNNYKLANWLHSDLVFVSNNFSD